MPKSHTHQAPVGKSIKLVIVGWCLLKNAKILHAKTINHQSNQCKKKNLAKEAILTLHPTPPVDIRTHGPSQALGPAMTV